MRDPDGNALGTITTTFDGERTTRTVEPTDGAPQTDIRDKDGPVATVQKVSPALAVPFLLEFAAIGAAIIGKAIGDTIARQGAAGVSGGSEMARPPGKDPGPGDNGPPERVEHDKPPQPGPPVPPFLPEPRPGWQQSELDVAKAERPDFVPQVSFKNGREVSWGTRGSVRPDGVSADMRSASFEVKNHNININTNANGLVNKVVRQVHERARHLPRGMQQNIRIDVRGQDVSSGASMPSQEESSKSRMGYSVVNTLNLWSSIDERRWTIGGVTSQADRNCKGSCRLLRVDRPA